VLADLIWAQRAGQRPVQRRVARVTPGRRVIRSFPFQLNCSVGGMCSTLVEMRTAIKVYQVRIMFCLEWGVWVGDSIRY